MIFLLLVELSCFCRIVIRDEKKLPQSSGLKIFTSRHSVIHIELTWEFECLNALNGQRRLWISWSVLESLSESRIRHIIFVSYKCTMSHIWLWYGNDDVQNIVWQTRIKNVLYSALWECSLANIYLSFWVYVGKSSAILLKIVWNTAGKVQKPVLDITWD